MKMRDIITIVETAPRLSNWLSDPLNLARYASYHHGAIYGDTEVGGGPVASFDWSFDPDFSVQQLIDGMTPNARSEWMKAEIQEIEVEEENDRGWGSMVGEEIQEPIVVVIMNGAAYCWDGNHRIGACCLGDVATLPAVVGMPRE